MKAWITKIDTITQAFTEAFGDLTTEEMNWKPSPDVWSVGQNLDHLITINRTYFPVFDALRDGTYKPPFMARFGFMVSFLGKTVLKAVQPDRKRKMKTFPIWEPSQSQIPPGILERFAAHQEGLKDQIERLAPLVGRGIVISSPANRNIVYRLETALDIIVTHEERHFEQAREVLQRRKE